MTLMGHTLGSENWLEVLPLCRRFFAGIVMVTCYDAPQSHCDLNYDALGGVSISS